MKNTSLNELLNYLHENIETDNQIRDGGICCPQFGVTITPEILSDGQNDTRVNFYLRSPEWDEPLCDRRIAPNITVAGKFFRCCYWDGIKNMLTDTGYEAAETSFDGKPHKWKIYSGDILDVGEDNVKGTKNSYLGMIKAAVLKRLGNQKILAVKMFVSRSRRGIDTDCLVNGLRSSELSQIAAEYTKEWKFKDFYSQEQHFFIKQDSETLLPYRYSGENGRAELMEKVKTAMVMFHDRAKSGDYDGYPDSLKQALNDPVLAWECYLFIPEVCAENYYYNIHMPESFLIDRGGVSSARQTVYKTQLADYRPIRKCVFNLFDSGFFAGETDDVYGEYVGFSSTAKAIYAAESRGDPVPDARGMAQIFQVDSDFELR